MNIRNNTILITGGGSGIGLALAKELLKLNNTIIICGRNSETLENAKRETPGLHTLSCDVSNEDSVKLLVQKILQKYPTLNVLVNNAGLMRFWNVQRNDINISEQKKEILTNVFGTIQLTQSFIPHLLKQKTSAVVNISSALAFLPMSAAPIYNATKAAIHSYSISTRQQLRNTSIKVFEVLPGGVETQMAKSLEKIIGADGGPTMTPEKLVQYIVKGLQKNSFEIRPGIANMLYYVHRFLPSFAQNMIMRQSENILKHL